MTSEQEQWLDQATAFQRAKRYDQAREYALRVVREDSRNTKALWIVASATNSLTERRNVLNMLLRVQPDNIHARQMLNAIDQERKATNELKAVNATSASPSKVTSEYKAVNASAASASSVIRPIKSNNTPQGHFLLYTTVAIALLIIAAIIAAGIIL